MTKQTYNGLTKQEILDELTESNTMRYVDNAVREALNRLAKLEEAVAFKGFDEPIEDGRTIQLLNKNGEIEDEWNEGSGVWNTCRYTGWRYPVGDLG